MRFETAKLSEAEDPQSQTPAAFGIEAYNLPTGVGASPAIAMCSADSGQNKTPQITDEIRNNPNGFDLCPWIPNGQIIKLVEPEGQRGG